MPDKKEPGLLKIYWEHALALLPTWGYALFFVWVFLFAGVATLGFGIISSLEAYQSYSWPSAQGIILLSQVDSYLSETDSGTTTMYHPQVSFNFSVNDQEYHSDLINLEDFSTSNVRDAEKIIARYPKGKVVSVF
ncbi:MAG: DUF3592 domain-containing protein, partial [Anaerolineaceae bacterium]|nr:DUF3592 domain-containing protein [Anaerolineaceae bacterium]